jgi:hypothetical protein
MEEEESVDGHEQEPTELEEYVSDITHVITCLYEFSITIRNPAPQDRLEKCST